MTEALLNILPKLEATRKEFHRYPEISGNEFETARRIETYLNKFTTAKIERITETAVLAIFQSRQPGKTILLRADTDALPIAEINDFEHQSKHAGVSHKCGHDGHTTILLGLAEMLSKLPLSSGKVFLLFQPAEENGKGAAVVLASNFFSNLSIDYVFALHNLPGFEKKEIVLKENIFNANVKSLIIELNGKTAHAAEPEKGFNPSLAIAKIIDFCEKLTNNVSERDDFFLIVPVYINVGEKAYGISAGKGELHLTIRSWDPKLFELRCSELEGFVTDCCREYKLGVKLSWTQEFRANQNDNQAIEIIRRAALKNGFRIREIDHPFKWGEDFGLFTQKYKGAMFGLGAGTDSPALHNPDYDFPDDITSTGIQQFFQIIQEINDY